MSLLFGEFSIGQQKIEIAKLSNESLFMRMGKIHLGSPAAILMTEFSLMDLYQELSVTCDCTNKVIEEWKKIGTKRETKGFKEIKSTLQHSRKMSSMKCRAWKAQLDQASLILNEKVPAILRHKRLATTTIIAGTALLISLVGAGAAIFKSDLPPELIKTVQNNEFSVTKLGIELNELRNLTGFLGLRTDVLDIKLEITWRLERCHQFESNLQDSIHRLERTLDHLFMGKLYHGLMAPMPLQQKLAVLFAEAKKRNLLPAIEGLADLFQLPTSFVIFANQTIKTITESHCTRNLAL